MKLHRGLGITQKAAWHLLHKIRYAMDNDNGLLFGTVEVNETFIGGLEKNKHADKKLHAGRGGVGKSTVIGMKDREVNLVAAKVIKNTNSQPCMNLFNIYKFRLKFQYSSSCFIEHSEMRCVRWFTEQLVRQAFDTGAADGRW